MKALKEINNNVKMRCGLRRDGLQRRDNYLLEHLKRTTLFCLKIQMRGYVNFFDYLFTKKNARLLVIFN